VRYCDGFSFAGHRDSPVTVTLPGGKKQTLHVRGRAILLATLKQLLALGLDRAESVMLTGDSAGGLAVFHAADFVGDFLRAHSPRLRTYKAVPVSGFFADHTDVNGVPQYANALRTAFAWHSASDGVSSACLAHAPPGDEFRCFFAEKALPYVRTPTFIL